MSNFESNGPFSDAQLADVRLANAPLAKVLAQLRFPGSLGKLVGDSLAAPLGDALADAGYPMIEIGQQLNFEFTQDGPRPQRGERIYSFYSADRNWQVSLTPEFVSLDTSAYIDRNDFARRLGELVDTLSKVLEIPGVSRVGYRYINRVPGATRSDISNWMRTDFHGAISVPEGNSQLTTHISEAMFSLGPQAGQIPNDGLLSRWGLLQPNQVFDPTIPPIDEPSWTLDIDAFRNGNIPFRKTDLIDEVRVMSERAYRFFRWAVTPEFMKRFGANDESNS